MRTVTLTLTEEQVKAIKSIAIYVQENSTHDLNENGYVSFFADTIIKESWHAELVADNGLSQLHHPDAFVHR